MKKPGPVLEISRLYSPNHHFYINSSDSSNKIVDTDGKCDPSCGILTIYNAEDKAFIINRDIANFISACLSTCDMMLEYSVNIVINSNITWGTNNDFILKSQQNITISQGVKITNMGSGVLKLMAGVNGDDSLATVKFDDGSGIHNLMGGVTKIYYNPSKEGVHHKHHNLNSYHLYVKPVGSLEAYVWVNCLEDLQDISYFLSGNYALSRDVFAFSTGEFIPLGNDHIPFSGNFDGNNHGIIGLRIEGSDQVGIFGVISGTKVGNSTVRDLWLKDVQVNGEDYVGLLAAEAEYASFINIVFVSGNKVLANSIAGGLVGSASGITVVNMVCQEEIDIQAHDYVGTLAGAVRDSYIHTSQNGCLLGSIPEYGFYENGE